MGAIDGAEDAARFFQERVASDRQRDAAGAIQEPGAEFIFEQGNLVGHGRLREIAKARGPREMPQLRDGDEGPQVTQFHSPSLSDSFNSFIGRITRELVLSLPHLRNDDSNDATGNGDGVGGSIATVVDDFIERLLVNHTLNANPAINQARSHVPKAGLKFQVTALVCEVTGGPCKYTGRAMKESHQKLNITEEQWQAMVADFRKTLDQFKVPAREQEELIAIVGSTKKDIVTPATGQRSGPETTVQTDWRPR